MNVREQVTMGILVCPRTRQKLQLAHDGDWLENSEKTERYRLRNGKVPILLADEKWAEEYASSSENMMEEYSPEQIDSLIVKIRNSLIRDHRTKASVSAFLSLFRNLTDDALAISIGGGPTRAHEKLININIGPFPNVEVVADAHHLPYADGCVDVVYCEAVFEHLHTPAVAAQEMFRVMKRGGRAFVCTPFLQPYHGYPHHYQDYTLTGHQLLFQSSGFKVVEAGSCVGPVYTFMQMGATFIRYYLPRPFNQILRAGWSVMGMLVRPLDNIIGKKENAHIMASTTYVLLEKP